MGRYPPDGDKVTQGKWWTTAMPSRRLPWAKGPRSGCILGVGSAVELETASGGLHKLKVAALYKADGEHVGARVPFVLPSGQLKEEMWQRGMAARMSIRNRLPMLERALFLAYPTVTVINIADVLSRIETVVDQITVVIRFLAGFSIFAGLTILASSIASTRFRRMREAVVLKTLGATRMRIVRTFSVEFSVLGLLAGLVGVIFANLLTRCCCTGCRWAFILNGRRRWWRWWARRCWRRRRDGLPATASWACGRWKYCAKSNS